MGRPSDVIQLVIVWRNAPRCKKVLRVKLIRNPCKVPGLCVPQGGVKNAWSVASRSELIGRVSVDIAKYLGISLKAEI